MYADAAAGSRHEALLADGSAAASGSTASGTRPPHQQRPKPVSTGLGTVSVLALVFFNVSGGPLGSEGIISSAGPLVGLAATVVFVAVYSLPQALITAELSTAFPENGGYSLWVHAAFGDFWAVQESYWSWVSGVVDSALYPVLMYSTASQLVGGWSSGAAEGHPGSHGHARNNGVDGHAAGGLNVTGALHASADSGGGSSHHANLFVCLATEADCRHEYGVKLLILLAFAAPNCASSRLVGLGVATLGLLVMAPYVAVALVGLPQVRLANLAGLPPHPSLPKLLSVLYWSLSGFDSASTFAGEVAEPSVTYPRALGLACLVMLFSYLLPLGVAAGADSQWPSWRDGSLTVVGGRLGGAWLSLAVMASSLLSNWVRLATKDAPLSRTARAAPLLQRWLAPVPPPPPWAPRCPPPPGHPAAPRPMGTPGCPPPLLGVVI